MISADLAGPTRAAIERLGRSGLDSEAFRREAIGRLQRTIPFAGWYWSVDDPATLFPAWTLAEGPPLGNQHVGERFWRRFWDIEEREPVARKLAILRRGPRHVGTLRQATGGELGRSRRWEELLRPFGMGDELHAALVLGGVCWGSLGLYRERAEGPFTPEEGALVQDLVVPLATGLRATLLNTPPAIQDVRDGPSLLLLGPHLSVAATTPTAERWLARLGGSSATLPPIVFALAARLRALEEGRATADLAPRARIRTVDGSWLVMHAARLSGPRSGDIAIMIESAGPGDLAPILVAQEQVLSHELMARARPGQDGREQEPHEFEQAPQDRRFPLARGFAAPQIAQTVYECASCQERLVGERRCSTCNLRCRKVGLGGECTGCGEIFTLPCTRNCAAS